jgi:hypothetical protein
MLGSQVVSDLQLNDLHKHIPFRTEWGKDAFQEGLNDVRTTPKDIKRKQLPLLGLRSEPVRNFILHELKNMAEDTNIVDDCLDNEDERIYESVEQILWPADSVLSMFNTNPTVLNGILVLKTIVAPGISLLTPLLAIILPFILAYVTPGANRDSAMLLGQVREVLRSQVIIPASISSRAGHSRLGSIVEMFFIAFALLVFVASLWTQITSALHLRSIWFDVAARGKAILRTAEKGKRILNLLQSLDASHKKAANSLIQEGIEAVEGCAPLEGLDGGAAYGFVWNDPTPLCAMRDWLARVDVLATIADCPGVCFPRIVKETSLTLRGVHHPAVPDCVPNDYKSGQHMLLTGPNRGGKSTFCKSIALALVTAQTWGFAYAESMTWSPFAAILTALEPCGKLGECSTFEAEIEFAKSVLNTKETPAFVMMDEIFHSTNAHDGVKASQVFLSQLYEKPDVVSIVSTHYAELTKLYEGRVSAQQLVATEDKGVLTYTYKVAPGVSTLSSVMEILEERGLSVRNA